MFYLKFNLALIVAGAFLALKSTTVHCQDSTDYWHKIENILPELAARHFSKCNLVIAHDNPEISLNLQKKDNLTSSQGQGGDNIARFPQANLSFTNTIHSLINTLFTAKFPVAATAGNGTQQNNGSRTDLLSGRDLYFVNYMTYNLSKSPYPSALGGVSRLRPNCFLTMIFIESVTENTFERLFKLLIPPVYELTKKDEDHYLIITKEELAETVLLSTEFTMRIQYKLLMYSTNKMMDKAVTGGGTPTPETDLLQFRTVCFYCKPGIVDKQKIIPVQLNLKNAGTKFPSKAEFFPQVVRNLNGHQMRIVCPTGTHQQARMKQLENGDWVPMRGSYFITMDNLVRVFNFTYKVGPSTLGGTGLQQPNGTWIGTVGDILYERADMGLVTAITYQRYKFIGYNYPVTWEWLTFGTAIPVPKFTWEALFWPLSKELWIGILISLFIVMIIFGCLQKFGKNLPHDVPDPNIGSFKPSSTITYVWGTLLDQSLTSPKSNPLKILVIFWLFLVLIVMTGYRSKLVTCLAFPVVEPPPTTFTELANSGYKVGLCYVGGAAYNVFKTSNNPTYIKLYKVMELFKDMTDCFVRTLQQRVSCIGYESMASYVLNKNLTDRFGRPQIQVTTASTFFVGCGYVISKRAIFRPNFDRYIMTWMDMGLLGRWRKIDHENVRKLKVKWEIDTEQDRSIGGSHEDDGPSKLNVENLKVVFVVLVLGVLAAAIAFIGELLDNFGWRNIQNVCKQKMQIIDRVLNKIR